jgi:type VI secretion system secreted protein VgrG
MPGPGSGSPGNVVSPAAPGQSHDADNADAGQVEQIKASQRQTQSGKYGSTPVTPFKPAKTAEEKKDKTSWIEIKLVDELGHVYPGEEYSVNLPDGSQQAGTLDDQGFLRIDHIPPGTCQVSFPKLENDAWKKR